MSGKVVPANTTTAPTTNIQLFSRNAASRDSSESNRFILRSDCQRRAIIAPATRAFTPKNDRK